MKLVFRFLVLWFLVPGSAAAQTPPQKARRRPLRAWGVAGSFAQAR